MANEPQKIAKIVIVAAAATISVGLIVRFNKDFYKKTKMKICELFNIPRPFTVEIINSDCEDIVARLRQ